MPVTNSRPRSLLTAYGRGYQPNPHTAGMRHRAVTGFLSGRLPATRTPGQPMSSWRNQLQAQADAHRYFQNRPQGTSGLGYTPGGWVPPSAQAAFNPGPQAMGFGAFDPFMRMLAGYGMPLGANQDRLPGHGSKAGPWSLYGDNRTSQQMRDVLGLNQQPAVQPQPMTPRQQVRAFMLNPNGRTPGGR